MCVGKFKQTSVKITQYLFGACRLVILARERQEFATARAGAVVFFLHFLFPQKENGIKKFSQKPDKLFAR